MADVIRLDLDDLDMSVANVQISTYMDVANASIHFGWFSNKVFSSTNPDLLDRIGELFLEAGRDLRHALASEASGFGQVRDDRSVA